MANYRICGLQVSSEFELPGAIPEVAQTASPDVLIRRGDAPTTLSGATATAPSWEIAGATVLLRVPQIARFLIKAGREITLDVEPGTHERDALVFVLGTAFGILLYQRGMLVLHGAAVAIDGRSIAICGSSGAGKSTLAAALCRDGCSFLADDICVVGWDERRHPVVLPDGRQLKLWKQSIDRLDLAGHRGDVVHGSFEKYYIHPPVSVAEPSRLSAIYGLRETRQPGEMGITRLALPDGMRMLEHESYRPELLAEIGRKTETFAQMSGMLRHATAFLLIRPRGFEHLADT